MPWCINTEMQKIQKLNREKKAQKKHKFLFGNGTKKQRNMSSISQKILNMCNAVEKPKMVQQHLEKGQKLRPKIPKNQ